MDNHEQISFTAKLVAYGRTFSDIPYARDVADYVGAKAVFDGMIQASGVSPKTLGWTSPFLEARYKSLVAGVKSRGIKQVIEFASGVSLRGLAMTSDPQITYVETDLPALTAEKQKLIADVKKRHRLGDRPNLTICAANILNWSEIEAALASFDRRQPVAVIHEGLMPYLSRAEKAAAARNIHRILEMFGGVWLTPDLNSKSESALYGKDQQGMMKVAEAIEARTHRSFAENLFEDEADIKRFCAELGFNARILPQIDGSYELSSAERLHVPQMAVDRLTDALKLWELTLRPTQTP